MLCACAVASVGESSVFFSQHDGDDALRYARIRRIRGVHRQAPVIVVDLEKDRVALDLERAKVVLFVRIACMAKVVEDCDCPDASLDGIEAESCHSRRYDCEPAEQVLAQSIVERTNALGF